MIALAKAIDQAPPAAAYDPPAPCPPQSARPIEIAVTDVDRLRADPYAFYAARILRLPALEPVDADPGPAWRGTRAHDVLQRWMEEGGGDPARLDALAREMIEDAAAHPLLRALWQPRLLAALTWVAEEVAALGEGGRTILFGETWGRIVRGGVTLRGKPDRIDSLPDGSIGVVDYKSGATASVAQVRAGYSLQLGLLGLIAQDGGFEQVTRGTAVGAFEYWRLNKGTTGKFGNRKQLTDEKGSRGRIVTGEFLEMVAAFFDRAAADWLTGSEPFAARPHSDAPVFTDYDQLMRLDEWFGRGRAGGLRG